MNLLTETLDYMKEIGKTQDDVLYVKMTKHTGFWHELNDSYPDEILVDFNTFASVANHVYNNGYGSSEVNTSTTILFKDNTVMHRWEYDGSEGWEYITLPRIFPKKYDKRMVAEFLWGKESCYVEDDDVEDDDVEDDDVEDDDVENDSDSKLSRVEEFVAKVGLFARQYPEFKHNIYSSGLPHNHFVKVVNVCFTTPNGKEQVAFCTMIDGIYNPYGEEEFNVELYKTIIDELDSEFDKILSEKKND